MRNTMSSPPRRPVLARARPAFLSNAFRRAATGLIAGTALLLAACGGGGGGGGPEPQPPPVIGQAADFWVTSADSTWVMDGTDRTGPVPISYRDKITIGAPMMLAGRQLVRFEATRPFNDDPLPQYRSFDAAEGVRAWLEGVPTTLALSYIELPAQIRAGSYRALDVTETVPGGTLNTRIDVNIVGFEPLVTPGASFASQALHTDHTFTFTATANGQSESRSAVMSLWYAKGLGIVRQQIGGSAQSSVSIDERLAGVMSGTIRAGVIGNLDLLTNLAPAGSSLSVGHPGVASDGAGYLVAARALDAALNARVQASYVGADGRVRWSLPAIADLGLGAPYDEFDSIAVTWDGQAFWIVARVDRPTGTGNAGLMRQRVTPSGALLDGPSGAPLASGLSGVWPALASDGQQVVAAYARWRDAPTYTYALYATLLNRDGSVARAEQMLVDVGNGNAGYPSIAYNAAAHEYLLGFERGSPRDVAAVRLSSDAGMLDPQPVDLCTAPQDQGGISVAAFGTAFVTLWIDGRSGPGSGMPERAVYAGRISAEGVPMDGAPALGGMAVDETMTSRFGTAAAGNADAALLLWTRGTYPSQLPTPGVFGHWVAAGAAIAPDSAMDRTITLESPSDPIARLMAPAAATDGSGFLAVWVDNVELIGMTKAVRGALVYPRYVGP